MRLSLLSMPSEMPAKGTLPGLSKRHCVHFRQLRSISSR